MAAKKTSRKTNTKVTSKKTEGQFVPKFKWPGFTVAASYLYVFLPVFLFVIGWLRTPLALALGIAVIAGVYLSMSEEEPALSPEKNGCNRLLIALVIAIITFWVLSAGIGGSVTQYPDHLYRNAIFKILAEHKWPVFLTDVYGNHRALSYYIGFWLPAAFFAKIAGLRAGMVFMQVWSVLGLYLIWRYICEDQKRFRVWFMVVLIFFGGADIIGFLLAGKPLTQIGNRLEWWAVIFNYPGASSQMFWVYNQVIYGWLIYYMIMRQKDNRRLAFIWSAGLISCTFPAAGMLPFAVYRAIKNSKGEDAFGKLKDAFAGMRSLASLAAILVILVSSAYALSNRSVALAGFGMYRSNGLGDIAAIEQQASEGDKPDAAVGEDSGEWDDRGNGLYVYSRDSESSSETKAGSAESVQSKSDESAPEKSNAENANAEQLAAEKSAAEKSAAEKSEENKPYSIIEPYRITTKLWIYLFFVLLEFGLFYILIYKAESSNPLYWISLVSLLIIPWLRTGWWMDFCLRGCIPALLCLYGLVLSALKKYHDENDKLRLAMLILVLIIGSASAIDSMHGVMKPMFKITNANETVEAKVISENIVVYADNYSAEPDSFFFKYLAGGSK